MKISELVPAQDLRDILNNSSIVKPKAYTAQTLPSSGLGDEYITVALNGAVERLTTGYDVYQANLLVTINVRLLSTGAGNEVRQTKILEQIEQVLSDNGYLTNISTVYEGKSLIANYSSKIVNILTRIIKK